MFKLVDYSKFDKINKVIDEENQGVINIKILINPSNNVVTNNRTFSSVIKNDIIDSDFIQVADNKDKDKDKTKDLYGYEYLAHFEELLLVDNSNSNKNFNLKSNFDFPKLGAPLLPSNTLDYMSKFIIMDDCYSSDTYYKPPSISSFKSIGMGFDYTSLYPSSMLSYNLNYGYSQPSLHSNIYNMDQPKLNPYVNTVYNADFDGEEINMNYKWKPLEENTIDTKLTEIKNPYVSKGTNNGPVSIKSWDIETFATKNISMPKKSYVDYNKSEIVSMSYQYSDGGITKFNYPPLEDESATVMEEVD